MPSAMIVPQQRRMKRYCEFEHTACTAVLKGRCLHAAARMRSSITMQSRVPVKHQNAQARQGPPPHLSMTQSVPSSTALATSVASARVGRGFFTMLSSICVAVMTGLPLCMHYDTTGSAGGPQMCWVASQPQLAVCSASAARHAQCCLAVAFAGCETCVAGIPSLFIFPRRMRQGNRQWHWQGMNRLWSASQAYSCCPGACERAP